MNEKNTNNMENINAATEALYKSGTLARNEDEEMLLASFRQLNDASKACELARLDGMITMQMYLKFAQ